MRDRGWELGSRWRKEKESGGRELTSNIYGELLVLALFVDANLLNPKCYITPTKYDCLNSHFTVVKIKAQSNRVTCPWWRRKVQTG